MKKGYTHTGLVLDASGSMAPIRRRVLDSLASYVETQLREAEPDETNRLDLWVFNSRVKHVLDGACLEGYSHMNYQCGGGTALYDAVGYAIDKLGQKFAAMPEEERPEDVVFVIVTDGQENSSRDFKLEDVRSRIETQTNVYNWRFIFLASNIDVEEVGSSLGVADAQARVALSSENFAEDMAARMNDAQCSVRERRAERRSRGE